MSPILNLAPLSVLAGLFVLFLAEPVAHAAEPEATPETLAEHIARLTPEQREAYFARKFTELDKNNDGQIVLAEAPTAPPIGGEIQTPEAAITNAKFWISLFDSDTDEVVSRVEYMEKTRIDFTPKPINADVTGPKNPDS